MSSAANRIAVRRMTVDCEVPRSHPCPDDVRARVEAVAGEPLLAALGHMLAPLAKYDGDEVVLIDRLRLTVDLDPSRDEAMQARRWAARLAETLALTIESGAAVAGVMRFPDRAAYAGCFFVDLARGRAWERWYYRRFEGLRPLSVAAALRTVVLDDVPIGLGALRGLSRNDLGDVLRALGGREARRIVETVGAADAGSSTPGRAVDAVAGVVAAWRARGASSAPPWQSALDLMALASREVDVSAQSALARVAMAVAAWADLEDGGRSPSEVGTTRGGASFDGPAESAPDEHSVMLAPLALLSAPERDRLAAAIGRRATTPPAGATATPVPLGATHAAAPVEVPVLRWTPFGGLILLLPHLAELPLADEWPDEADRAIARLLLLARCAGAARVHRVLGDPVIRDLVDAPDDLTSAQVTVWLETNAARLAPGLASRLARRAAREGGPLTLTIGRGRDRGALLVGHAPPEAAWAVLAPLAPAPLAAVRAHGVEAVTPETLAGVAASELRLDLRLSTVRAVTRALAHLRADGASGAPATDLALTLAAQHMLCAFARRLPGFAESSPGYLYQCFLDIDATLTDVGARRICRLGRPRLAALLGLTGTTRGRIATPWRSGPPLDLYSGS